MGVKIDAIKKRVNNDLKEQAFTRGIPVYEYEKIPFTSPKLNWSTYGGLPLGRLIEFYGEEGGGKTTTALDVVANFQNMFPDRDVYYVDAENTLDTEWARKIGVNVDAIELFQPKVESAEYIFQVIKEVTMTGEAGIWVLDSVPCLTPEKDLGKDLTDDARVAGVSGILTRFCREIVGPCRKYNCMGIFINQIRDKINSTVPGMTQTPGGRGLKHFCTTRIEFRKGGYRDEDGKSISRSSGNPESQKICYNMQKTKFCSPKRHLGEYTINFNDGIDFIEDLIMIGIDYGIVEKSGAWFNVVNTDTGEILNPNKIQGQANLHAFLEENEDVCELVEQLVYSKMEADD